MLKLMRFNRRRWDLRQRTTSFGERLKERIVGRGRGRHAEYTDTSASDAVLEPQSAMPHAAQAGPDVRGARRPTFHLVIL